jgi:hypothetical protein
VLPRFATGLATLRPDEGIPELLIGNDYTKVKETPERDGRTTVSTIQEDCPKYESETVQSFVTFTLSSLRRGGGGRDGNYGSLSFCVGGIRSGVTCMPSTMRRVPTALSSSRSRSFFRPLLGLFSVLQKEIEDRGRRSYRYISYCSVALWHEDFWLVLSVAVFV